MTKRSKLKHFIELGLENNYSILYEALTKDVVFINQKNSRSNCEIPTKILQHAIKQEIYGNEKWKKNEVQNVSTRRHLKCTLCTQVV